MPQTLIKQEAKLVETAQDVLEELHWASSLSEKDRTIQSATSSASSLLFMGFDHLNLDQLALMSGLVIDSLSVSLPQLELEGRVASLPGGRYQQLVRN